jgi:metal-responsive CopG/Arc/MetJ family transcriptional regulator
MQMPITTSLSESLLKQVDIYIKETGKKKNQVIEESLTQFLLNEKKAKFVASFKRAATDNDLINMAEEGMADYKKQLKKLKI